ncbi:pentatricopeptide repeat-containing protein At2g13600-like, partial [Selaginella moellendorffii]|uniref:pentatricopeptide repeat-containing protein At2g13600-like n=1 Tax=Selaginella moellendorffii TaxID=88036 RepID=UPI000D1C54FC
MAVVPAARSSPFFSRERRGYGASSTSGEGMQGRTFTKTGSSGSEDQKILSWNKIKQEEDKRKKEMVLELIAALKAASGSRAIERGRQLHAAAIESGNGSNFYVASSLVSMYARCGCMGEARSVFDAMEHHDVVLWTALMLGYSKNGQGEVTLELFSRMLLVARPNSQTFLAVLKGLSSLAAREEGRRFGGKVVKTRTLERVMAVHLQAEGFGCELDNFVASSLVDIYARCGSMRDARRVFDRMPSHNLVAWTALILGYATNGENEVGLRLFARVLGEEGRRTDSQAFVAALKACTGLTDREVANDSGVKIQCLEKGMAVHREAAKSGVATEMFVGSVLVDTYAKCGSMEDSRIVFEKMVAQDVVSWTALLFGYAQNGESELTLGMFERMKASGCAPNAQTFVAVLHACTNLALREDGIEEDGKVLKVKALEKGMAVHREAFKGGFEPDICVSSTLVDMYSKCGSVLQARRVFDRMKRHDVVSWTALILGCAQNDEGDMALELFTKMRLEEKRCQPDDQTFVAALKACSTVASLEFGKKIHADICRCGLEAGRLVTNSVVDFYGKCGSMVVAHQVFDSARTRARDIVSWNSLITGYSRHGETDAVLELFARMVEEGFQPDGITTLAVLNACCHAGLVERGRKLFQEMCSRKAASVTMEHYHVVVDMLGRANKLQEAVEMADSMPFAANVVTWTIVLSSCHKWKSLEFGRLAFEALVKLDEKQAATYVLMANIYGSLGMVEEKARVHAMSKRIGAWKRGSVVVNLDSFVNCGDHPQKEEEKNYYQTCDRHT